MTLAIDLGTECGWALGGLVAGIPHVEVSGTWHLAAKTYGGSAEKFWIELTELKQRREFDAIVYEDVKRHLGTDAAHWYGAYEIILHFWAKRFDVREIQACGPGQWKKHGLEIKGNADKAAVIRAVQAKQLQPKDSNEADAIGILFWSLLREKKEMEEEDEEIVEGWVKWHRQ